MATVRDPGEKDDYRWRSTRMYMYPWNQWLDGRHWILTPGVDFKGDVASFRAYCYKTAKIFVSGLRTSVDKDGNLHIQALDDDGNPAILPPEA